MITNDKRIRIIVGSYGVGKSEFSINYAIKLAQENRKVAIADIDVANMYFRSRGVKKLLEESGVRVIGGSIESDTVEAPLLSAEVFAPLQDKSYDLIIDVGGDTVGATVLGSYYDYLKSGDYDMFYVINAYRPGNDKVEDILAMMDMIEGASRCRITGLINNTHMLKSTSKEDILHGNKIVKEVSSLRGLPIKYNVGIKSALDDIDSIEGEKFPIDMTLRDSWMY